MSIVYSQELLCKLYSNASINYTLVILTQLQTFQLSYANIASTFQLGWIDWIVIQEQNSLTWVTSKLLQGVSLLINTTVVNPDYLAVHIYMHIMVSSLISVNTTMINIYCTKYSIFTNQGKLESSRLHSNNHNVYTRLYSRPWVTPR